MDYAVFSIALDRHELLSEEMLERAWTPFTSNRGRSLPYGYGWFVQKRSGVRILWHYGYWRCTSTLVVKVPDRGLTFLLFANSDRLSSPFNLGIDENVCRSPAARAFLDIFVFD
jgi:CubicO group peptidase (beta-lactamase class C family)